MFRNTTFPKTLFKVFSTSLTVIGTIELTTHLPSQGRSSSTYHTLSDDYFTPWIRQLFHPEDAHNLALFLLRHQLAPRFRPNVLESSSQVQLQVAFYRPTKNSMNHKSTAPPLLLLLFPNCIGLAAGFDKDGIAIQSLMDIGFGFIEIGSITPKPQPGNPKPRMFRLLEDGGVINRFGFNSLGLETVLQHVTQFRQEQQQQQWMLLKTQTENGCMPASTSDDHETPSTQQQQQQQQQQQEEETVVTTLLGMGRKTWKYLCVWCSQEYHRFQKQYQQVTPEPALLGINLGKNKLSEHETEDYVTGISKLGIYADYITINISSPNTPGLRNLQKKEPIRRLFQAVLQARDSLPSHPHPSSFYSTKHIQHTKEVDSTTRTTAIRQGVDIPIFVKISPDCTDEELDDIASAIMEFQMDGIIISNTTNQRPTTLQSIHKHEMGGLSGRPLKNLSTECIRKMYQRTQGQVFIIGVGGVESGRDAYEKIKAGASVIQLYSAMVYQGAGMISRIRKELAEIMLENGHRTIDDVIGLDHDDIYLKRQVGRILQ